MKCLRKKKNRKIVVRKNRPSKPVAKTKERKKRRLTNLCNRQAYANQLERESNPAKFNAQPVEDNKVNTALEDSLNRLSPVTNPFSWEDHRDTTMTQADFLKLCVDDGCSSMSDAHITQQYYNITLEG